MVLIMWVSWQWSALELASIKKLNNSILEQLYKDDVIGYMMSCNYYPKPLKYSAFAKNNTRLSAHKDVSLFTTFPFGIANGLSFFNEEKNRVAVGEKNTIIQFSGYFLEFVSQHKIKALEHQVNLPKDLNTERYSFAIFSIPFFPKITGTPIHKSFNPYSPSNKVEHGNIFFWSQAIA